MHDILQVPDDIMRCIGDRIVKLGRFWAEHPKRPRPKRDAREHWEKLIVAWAKDGSLPLYVRKGTDNRGSIVRHKSQRLLIQTDNSPARWAFVLACKGDKPSFEEVKNMVRRDRIPIAMVFSRREKRKARYRCTLRELQQDCPNSAGWKVAHINRVGLKISGSPKELDIQTLKDHFVKLMTPSNMFVVPKDYAGLAELPEFCHQIKP
jgi:hypothetical protein